MHPFQIHSRILNKGYKVFTLCTNYNGTYIVKKVFWLMDDFWMMLGLIM